ncbi:leucine-rich repeat domain-containing protein [Chloroflexota bacterium]
MTRKVFLILLALVLALSVGLVACGGAGQQEEEEEEERYDLIITSTAGGQVTTPGEGTFNYTGGTAVNLVAEAEEGYRFVNWSGDVEGIDDINAASTTIAVNDNYSVTANFIARYVLTIDSTDDGDVTAPGEGTFTYDEGTIVILEASPDIGYRFMNWTGDVGNISDVGATVTTITIDTDCTVTASFEEDEIVAFVDPYLEAAVRQTIGILERPLYARDVEQLTELVADWVPISDLSGLEYATHLTYIHLEVNEISDISPLAGLTNLTRLAVTNCPLSDISPVANLTNLTGVNFEGGCHDVPYSLYLS